MHPVQQDVNRLGSPTFVVINHPYRPELSPIVEKPYVEFNVPEKCKWESGEAAYIFVMVRVQSIVGKHA